MIDSKFVNAVDFNIPVEEGIEVTKRSMPDVALHTTYINNLVSSLESKTILGILSTVNWLPVSITGMAGNYQEGDPIGSWRTSNFNPDYADVLWSRIQPLIQSVRTFHKFSPTDYDGHTQWKAVGVNPLLRFIKYTDGGLLVPHYDAPFIESDNRRTLMSLVIYLDNDPNITGGSTRFLSDPQVDVPVKDRHLQDWENLAEEKDVRIKITPHAGDAIIFDHRILHDSEPVTGEGQKTIIRTDILFEKM